MNEIAFFHGKFTGPTIQIVNKEQSRKLMALVLDLLTRYFLTRYLASLAWLGKTAIAIALISRYFSHT